MRWVVCDMQTKQIVSASRGVAPTISSGQVVVQVSEQQFGSLKSLQWDGQSGLESKPTNVLAELKTVVTERIYLVADPDRQQQLSQYRVDYAGQKNLTPGEQARLGYANAFRDWARSRLQRYDELSAAHAAGSTIGIVHGTIDAQGSWPTIPQGLR